MTLILKKEKNTKNDFEKSLFKLMKNSAYGKTMERINVSLVNNAKGSNMLANQLLFNFYSTNFYFSSIVIVIFKNFKKKKKAQIQLLTNLKNNLAH